MTLRRKRQQPIKVSKASSLQGFICILNVKWDTISWSKIYAWALNQYQSSFSTSPRLRNAQKSRKACWLIYCSRASVSSHQKLNVDKYWNVEYFRQFPTRKTVFVQAMCKWCSLRYFKRSKSDPSIVMEKLYTYRLRGDFYSTLSWLLVIKNTPCEKPSSSKELSIWSFRSTTASLFLSSSYRVFTLWDQSFDKTCEPLWATGSLFKNPNSRWARFIIFSAEIIHINF